MGSALPLVMARKSASASSSVQSGLSVAPEVTPPLPFFASTVHVLSGLVSLNTNVQKLDFLKKIDPKQALEAVQKKRGGGAPAAAAAPAVAAAPKGEPKAPAIMKALGERLAKNPALAKEVGAVLALDVTAPDGHWTIDMTGSGAVREGKDAKVTTTLRIEDADLVALSKDPSQVREFFQRGKLRVDGDVRPAHKLGFLKDLI
jgi:(3R)-3-hydroxyacyl-CoA dehydrogenase / 3a,7a,12a-trihydroxy-5b-cholest-24-enoyl-CoA hydratase / enoyl-CoA hydratase 2